MGVAGVDSRVRIGAVELPNPVIAASGTFGYGSEFAGIVPLGAVGAISVKGLSLRPYEGSRSGVHSSGSICHAELNLVRTAESVTG